MSLGFRKSFFIWCLTGGLGSNNGPGKSSTTWGQCCLLFGAVKTVSALGSATSEAKSSLIMLLVIWLFVGAFLIKRGYSQYCNSIEVADSFIGASTNADETNQLTQQKYSSEVAPHGEVKGMPMSDIPNRSS